MELSIKEIIAILGFLSAAIWFYWTQKFKPRVEFDVDCEFFQPGSDSDKLIAEIRFVFKNMGFVQHTIKYLELSVHGLMDESRIISDTETQNIIFKDKIFERSSIVPKNWYYWVRPNVNQIITKVISIDKRHSVIRVIAGFSYRDSKKSRHTAQRIFQVSKIMPNKAINQDK